MPKKKPGMTPEEQSQRFREAAQRMMDDGELSATEADAALDRLVAKARTPKDAEAD